jgi:hypothetical protein
MRWLAVTIILLALNVCLVTWMYFRDRDTSGSLAPERSLAYVDALSVGHELGFACHHGRGKVAVLGSLGQHLWLTRIATGSRTRCYELDLDTFSASKQHRLAGVRTVGCRAVGDGARDQVRLIGPVHPHVPAGRPIGQGR